MGRREDEDSYLEALAAVERALAGGGERTWVALPRVLSSEVARRLEEELRARGLVAARYTDVPRTWDLWDRLETVLGLDEDEPRVEWDSRRESGSTGS